MSGPNVPNWRRHTVTGPSAGRIRSERSDVAEDDPCVDQVHHHSKLIDQPRWMAGEAVPTLCGMVKRRHPNAWELPCCPMCAAVMRVKCLAEVSS